MYLAHKCPQCHERDVLYSDKPYCDCGFTEDQDKFWKNLARDAYLRDLESEIEDNYPFRELRIIDNQFSLIVGYHITGRNDARDFCLKNTKERIIQFYEKWGAWYYDYSLIDKVIAEYEAIPRTGKPKDDFYITNIETAKKFLKDFPNECKEALKNHDFNIKEI